MRPHVALAAVALLSGCAPFNATVSGLPPSPTPQPTDDELIKAYVDCVNGYAIERVHFDVTAYELADAAIGACGGPLNTVRARYALRLDSSASGERIAAKLREDAREGVLTLIVEARNRASPQKSKPVDKPVVDI